MAKIKILQSNIRQRGVRGDPAFLNRSRLVYIGLPIDQETGLVAMNSTTINFLGSFEGKTWHSINRFDGQPLALSTKASSKSLELGFGLEMGDHLILPIANPELFAGLAFVMVLAASPEDEERNIRLYSLE